MKEQLQPTLSSDNGNITPFDHQPSSVMALASFETDLKWRFKKGRPTYVDADTQ